MKKIAFATLALAFLTSAPAFAQNAPATEEERIEQLNALTWEIDPGDYALANSSSTLSLGSDLAIVRNEDARRFNLLIQGVEAPAMEAYVEDTGTGVGIYFEYFDEGYVTLDDWQDMDADGLLDSIRESTEAANEERAKVGMSPLVITGWIETPRLDAASNTAYWTIELEEDGQSTVNAVALKLGRRGYEQITWVGMRADYEANPGLLATMIENHEYDTGFRYAEFTDGDMLAGFGIASLVAVTAGANTDFGKGILVGLLLFLKKGWILLVAASIGAWAAIKKFFFGGKRRMFGPVR